MRFWLTLWLAAFLAACATNAPTEETTIRFGRITKIESVTIDGDAHLGVGAIIGAVAGGVLGHQIGGGTGRDVATVAGVLAGGYAGSKVQAKTSDKRTGHHIIVQLDNGVSVGVTQPADPLLRVGDKVRIEGSGEDARVMRQ
jgi:outer membrane lipoprotein SlyB